ncbi:hypothetical protein L7F22_051519 [Adiantum nelumboides]|nr:hypothetical protein [Adiantum nelumboides]
MRCPTRNVSRSRFRFREVPDQGTRSGNVWAPFRPFPVTMIMQPFSLQEVTDAVHGLDGASCPGDDGLTRQFFLQDWDLVSQPLQEGLQEIFDSGIMPQSMSSGIISLTPKGGDASTLRQWRPITLMSSVYKILARMITSRLRPFLPDLIHSSQTGFVQDRSILDNVVTFYEAVEWVRQTGQPTAIMHLDFEKAYDRVDWGFLEGTLHRMGFPDAWIRGISALHRSSSAAVTIGGHVGRIFALSRSVRQGCPLAPYLFLFFAETMASYFRGRTPQIRGLHMPVDASPDLVEQEYVDDTMIFCQYDSDTLDRLQFTLSVFCCASGSLINWHKSSGFVVGVDDVCTWGDQQGFTWVAPGQTCRYLGFHVGLDVSPRQQFEPVLASIRRKLYHWASMHLSLTGRALVVNQVLLATAWFTTSCWTLYPQALSRLRRLVRNFLWGGSDGTRDTRTRVSWRTVILARQEGSLGIIDPEMQSAALLSKLIVRGLYPDEEPWKQFVIHGLSRCVPSSGSLELLNAIVLVWIFTPTSQLGMSKIIVAIILNGSLFVIRFSDAHGFQKPNDISALNLMNDCAKAVMEDLPDIVFAYGVSDEYSFVIRRESNLYKRRASKLVSIIVSLFAATYVFKWQTHFSDKQLQYPPAFDGRAICYPEISIIRDYLSWRQVDCHINNQYNTCLWSIIRAGKSKDYANNLLKGTRADFKNEMLFKDYGINYNDLPAIFRKGSYVFRKTVSAAAMMEDNVKVCVKQRYVLTIEHGDIISDTFWKENPHILGIKEASL